MPFDKKPCECDEPPCQCHIKAFDKKHPVKPLISNIKQKQWSKEEEGFFLNFIDETKKTHKHNCVREDKCMNSVGNKCFWETLTKTLITETFETYSMTHENMEILTVKIEGVQERSWTSYKLKALTLEKNRKKIASAGSKFKIVSKKKKTRKIKNYPDPDWRK